MITQKPIEFWIAVGVAVIVKIKTSQRITPLQALMTIAVSVGAAYVATDWVASVSGMSEAVAAALVAIAAPVLAAEFNPLGDGSDYNNADLLREQRDLLARLTE